MPIPGALEFTRAAAAKGVTVFYVTNRDRALEQATRDNLAKFGFPLDPSRDTVLTRAERPEWTSSDKSSRRSVVAQDFRILLLVGDDFGDFVQGARGTLAARKALDEANAAMWGVKWIALPNPMYGSWKTAAGVGNQRAGDRKEKGRGERDAPHALHGLARTARLPSEDVADAAPDLVVAVDAVRRIEEETSLGDEVDPVAAGVLRHRGCRSWRSSSP